MKYYILLLFLIIISSCTTINEIAGTYNEECTWPSHEVLMLNEDSTFSFKGFYDIIGQYAHGTYSLKFNKITLHNNEIQTDTLILLDTKSNISDSCFVTIKIVDLNWDHWLFFYSSDLLIGQTPIIDDVASIKLPRDSKQLIVKIGSKRDYKLNSCDLFINHFSIGNYSECSYEYYPSNSFFKFNTLKFKNLIYKKFRDVIRLKNNKIDCYIRVK